MSSGARLSLTSNSNLVSKVYFPREIFPFSSVLVCLVDLAAGSLFLVAFMAYYRIVPGTALLLLPVIVIIHLMFTAGLALFLAMGNLFYRDVKYLFEVGITVFMFATSVAYPVHRVGGKLGYLLALNPITQIIEAYRSVILYNRVPALIPLAATAVLSLFVLVGSWLVFHRAEFTFAENI